VKPKKSLMAGTTIGLAMNATPKSSGAIKNKTKRIEQKNSILSLVEKSCTQTGTPFFWSKWRHLTRTTLEKVGKSLVP
jgi:hypothetical protein